MYYIGENSFLVTIKRQTPTNKDTINESKST